MKIFLSYIFFLLIKKIISQTCGVPNPDTNEDCKNDSSKNSLCCYAAVSLEDDQETLCVYVPKTQVFITPFITSMDIGLSPNNLKMKIDCGYDPDAIEEGQPYSVCRKDPETPQDCFANSTQNASCCYIKNPDGVSVCLLNTGIYKDNQSYFGIDVICFQSFLAIKFAVILGILLILF